MAILSILLIQEGNLSVGAAVSAALRTGNLPTGHLPRNSVAKITTSNLWDMT